MADHIGWGSAVRYDMLPDQQHALGYGGTHSEPVGPSLLSGLMGSNYFLSVRPAPAAHLRT
jgi:hypothetical protein